MGRQRRASFLKHFNDIYINNNDDNLCLIENLYWSPISSQQQDDLCFLFAELEILRALKSFSNNKSHGPDDFTMKFYNSSRHLFKGDIFKIFSEFHDNCIINKAVIVTNIALNAKKEKCSVASEYKPTSLATSLYKLMAKVLAET